MASDAKLKANAKYIATLDRIVIQPKYGKAQQGDRPADQAGGS